MTPKVFFLPLLVSLIVTVPVCATANVQQISDTYVEKWIDFYPSEAYTYGNKAAAWHFENFSGERVSSWLQYNRKTLEELKQLKSVNAGASVNEKINARVLRRQCLLELERWHHDEVLDNQAIYYAELISQALTYLLVRDQFTPAEKLKVLQGRLRGVQASMVR